ncbi:class I SAM-dependent methyltransferase [Aliarcobacter lanthieri]|uniref:class I SAM-dependent methyltransferase n=1 Tax=Aliarcobacter lanthieri TaxID=1355374 RepID=UPI00047BBEB4|nr:class I SAM-dependent methyltransferase [Aliarcobacter lanthieri]QKF58564.1 SAM-dependent methyltransferase [Aliarcobacter lanthieri]
MFDFYGKLSSEVYELDKPIGSSFGDVEYYLSRLKDIKGPILEPATGTGRILIPLLEAGLDVSGFDLSNEMLDICKNNCNKRNLNPELFIDKMEIFKTDKKYNAIIVPTGTFLLIYEREKSIKALKNFYNHLNIGGKLILDIEVQNNINELEISNRSWTNEKDEIINLSTQVMQIDYINQFTIYHNIYEKIKENKVIQNELEKFVLRWYGIEEFKLILESLGYKNIVISSDYKYNSYPNKAGQIVTFEATK